MPLRSVLYNPDDVIVDILDLAVLPDRGLNILEDPDPGHGVHKAGHPPVLDAVYSPHPAHAVDVVCRVQGEVVIDHVAKKYYLKMTRMVKLELKPQHSKIPLQQGADLKINMDHTTATPLTFEHEEGSGE